MAVLLCLGAASVALRATWHEVEDGVLWIEQDGGVVAAEIAPRTSAARVGLRPGDILLQIDNTPIFDVADVVETLHRADGNDSLLYTVLRQGANEQA